MGEYWIFTFGYGQRHAGQYVKIFGTFGEARKKMFDLFGDKWAFQYSELEWKKWEKERPPYYPIETELAIIE